MDLNTNSFRHNTKMLPFDQDKTFMQSLNNMNQLESIDEIEEIEEIEETEQSENFENHDITPPLTPPSPPGPPAPPSPLWTQQDFNFYTSLIQSHLNKLENIVIGPHIILINGIQHLRPRFGQTWKSRLNHLLFEARIPFFWIIDILPDNDDDDEGIDNDENNYDNEENQRDPYRVRMYVINHHVKIKVLDLLNTYLRMEYDNIVYLE